MQVGGHAPQLCHAVLRIGLGGVQGEGAVGRLFEGAAGDAARAVDALDGFEVDEGGLG